MTADDRPSDLEWGAFSDHGPWVLDPTTIEWTDAAADGRRQAAALVPTLIAHRRLPGRRAPIVTLRLGRAVVPWLIRQRLHRYPTSAASTAAISARLRRAAEDLGPTTIKLGQIISAGQGLFPAELVAEFIRCRDQVPAERPADVRAVLETELGAPLESVFATFDPRPLAAASIAQVHAATLRDGPAVVVKVQRPNVAEVVRADLQALAWLAPALVGRIPVAALANPPALVELFAQTISEELDFRVEAANMVDVARTLVDVGQRGYVVPRPHPSLVTRRMLVMERMHGMGFEDVDTMRASGIDPTEVIRTGMIAFMEGALLHGIFHGDLHAGNLMVLPDGRTALLDFGITARLDNVRRIAFLRLMMSGIVNDARGQIVALRDLGALPSDVDIDEVVTDLRLDQKVVDPTTLAPEELVAEIQRVVKALLGYGAKMPKELMLYVKNLVFLDGAIARLAPELDLMAEFANVSMQFTATHGAQLGRDLGTDAGALSFDPQGVRASFGLDESVSSFTYADLRQRRELITKRLRR
jgi:ubiquinone biosynthesis protein